jgi:phage terminase small subunit
MNQRQRAFCEAYLLSGNATEAAIKAGYSPKSARSIGQRLLTFADIREYLAQRNAQIIAENTATLEEIYSFWTVTMRDQASKPADRLKASELLSKALTLERTRSEERAAAGTLNPFDSLTDEELRRLSEMDDGLE